MPNSSLHTNFQLNIFWVGYFPTLGCHNYRNLQTYLQKFAISWSLKFISFIWYIFCFTFWFWVCHYSIVVHRGGSTPPENPFWQSNPMKNFWGTIRGSAELCINFIDAICGIFKMVSWHPSSNLIMTAQKKVLRTHIFRGSIYTSPRRSILFGLWNRRGKF